MILRIVAALILIPIVLVLIFKGPLWLFLAVAELFMLSALWELTRFFPSYGARVFPIVYPLTALAPLVGSYRQDLLLAFLLFGGLLMLSWSVAFSRQVKEGFPSASINLTAFLYLGVSFTVIAHYHPCLAESGCDDSRGLELALVMAVIWVSDGAAYFVGRAFGKRKVTPMISPNKSLEGFVAAMAAAVLTALAGGTLFLDRSPPALAVIGAVVGLAGILGDLFESLLKRGAGIKDASNLIPGHGGVLDRIDSLLFAVPAYYLISLWL